MNDLSHHAVLPMSVKAAREMLCEGEIVERILRGEWPQFWEDNDYRDDFCAVLWDLFKAKAQTHDSDTALGEASLAVMKMAKDYAYHYVLSADAQDLSQTLGVE